MPGVVPADLLGPPRRHRRRALARRSGEPATSPSQRAQFYPNINLTAFIGLSSIGLDRLVRAGSEQYGVGPAIRLPIFDAGRLRANLRGRDRRPRRRDRDLQRHARSTPMHDVADQISSTRSIERQQRAAGAGAGLGRSGYDLATQRYRAGLGNYLTVLNAETNVLAAAPPRPSTCAHARSTSQMLLVRALGGGYARRRARAPSRASTSRAR